MKMIDRDYKYTVAIQCMTYNHSKYIIDALNGFVMQNTDFPYVILLVDDASNDGEQIVISEYIEINFNLNDASSAYTKETDYARITYAQHKTNSNCFMLAMYLKYNHYQIGKKYEKLKYISEWLDNSKYIALCEGDDYWIDSLKLQKQVDFLEENLEYVMVYTNAKKYYQSEGLLKNGYWGNCDNSYEFLLQNNPIATLTVLYRKEAISDYDKVINPSNKGWLLGDYPLWLWLSLQGKIKFLQEYTSVYRVLEQSASHFKDYDSTKRFALSSISVKEFFMGLFGVTYRKFINDSNNRLLFNLAYAYKNIDDVKYYYRKIVSKSIKDRLKYLISIIAQSK